MAVQFNNLFNESFVLEMFKRFPYKHILCSQKNLIQLEINIQAYCFKQAN